MTTESVHQRIRRLRKARRLNQTELAALVDSTQATISAVELGRKPSLELAERLARVFGLPVDELDPYAGLRARAAGRVVVTYVPDDSAPAEMHDSDWREDMPTLAAVLAAHGELQAGEMEALELVAEAIEGRLAKRRAE